MGDMHEKINFDSLKEVQTEDGKLSDKLLADKYINECHLYSINRLLYDFDGAVDVGFYKKDLAQIVSIFRADRISSRVNDIFDLMIMLSHTSEVQSNKNEIPVKNGTILVDGSDFSFSEEKHPTLYRLSCDFDPNAGKPMHFLEWVNGLFHEEILPVLESWVIYFCRQHRRKRLFSYWCRRRR